MAMAFDRQQLRAAFDEIAHAAVAANTRLEIAVFGGSALILAGNFRFSTEDACPKSGADADKQRFVLRRLLAGEGSKHAPSYPQRER